MENSDSSVALDLEVMLAAQVMGEIVARTILAECPGLDLAGLTDSCAQEVFLASQDMKRCAWAESVQQAARLRAEGEAEAA